MKLSELLQELQEMAEQGFANAEVYAMGLDRHGKFSYHRVGSTDHCKRGCHVSIIFDPTRRVHDNGNPPPPHAEE